MDAGHKNRKSSFIIENFEFLEVEEEKPLEIDDLDQDSDNVPSETGTYTLRLDSAEVRERKNLVNITQESMVDQNSATESADLEYSTKTEPGEAFRVIFSLFTRFFRV